MCSYLHQGVLDYSVKSPEEGRSSQSLTECLSIVRICSSKPLADSNTVLLFKAISNMSCLTSFKSYLTLHNSCEFTVRIKERNSQRGEKLSLAFCSAKGTWQGCLPRDEYIITHLQHNAFQRHEKGSWKSLPYILIADIMENGIKTACCALWGKADVSGDQTLQLGLMRIYMSTIANGCKPACVLPWSISL